MSTDNMSGEWWYLLPGGDAVVITGGMNYWIMRGFFSPDNFNIYILLDYDKIPSKSSSN